MTLLPATSNAGVIVPFSQVVSPVPETVAEASVVLAIVPAGRLLR
jgi:hypothetical protein